MSFKESTTVPRPQEKPDKIEHPVLKRLEGVRQRLGLSKEAFANSKLSITGQTYYRWCWGSFEGLSWRRIKELEELASRLESELEGGNG